MKNIGNMAGTRKVKFTVLCHIAVCFLLSGWMAQVECLNCPDNSCPDNLPFCSPVGCVFECPKGSFIDGNTCITNCEDRFIHDRQCVEVCPASEPLVETKILTVGVRFVRYRFCRSVCPKGTYVSGNTCVRSCPEDAKFVEGGLCRASCPANTYLRNTTMDGQLTAVMCVQSCSGDSRQKWVLDGYCVEQCRQGQAVYNGACLDKCPREAEIRYKDDYTGMTFCTGKCDFDLERPYKQRRECVSKCDAGLVIASHICQAKCPTNRTLKYVDPKGNVHCREHCQQSDTGAQFLEDGYCVWKCKQGHVVYKDSCVTGCPASAPIHALNFNDQNVHCQINCENSIGSFVFNNSCVKDCPNGKDLIFNETCVTKCPIEAPFYCSDEDRMAYDGCDYDYTRSYRECLTECPDSLSFDDNNMCGRDVTFMDRQPLFLVVGLSAIAIGIIVTFGVFMSMKKFDPFKICRSGSDFRSSSDDDARNPLRDEDNENVVQT